jgi:hypothetical protein
VLSAPGPSAEGNGGPSDSTATDLCGPSETVVVALPSWGDPISIDPTKGLGVLSEVIMGRDCSTSRRRPVPIPIPEGTCKACGTWKGALQTMSQPPPSTSYTPVGHYAGETTVDNKMHGSEGGSRP